MFQLDFGINARYPNDGIPSALFRSNIDRNDIDYLLLTRWEEHCLECSAPDCFRFCSMYQKRQDFMCQRFEYGIVANPGFNGLFDFGADIRFRRWGKLEAKLAHKSVKCQVLSGVVRRDLSLLKLVQPLTAVTNRLNRFKKANPSIIYQYFRQRFLRSFFERHEMETWAFDEFLIEAINPDQREFTLNIQITANDEPVYRTAILMRAGYNLHRIPSSDIGLDLERISGPQSRISIYPSNDYEARIIFTWLHFVKYKPYKKSAILNSQPISDKAKQIKCVVWDLDNTLWNGILIEDGKESLTLREDSVTIVRQLDERGVIQTISSKNNHEDAWEALKQFELDKYFVYPAINWDPKSQNIKLIAQDLNIHLDTFAFIDDSAFERAEVSDMLPEVRTYADTEISTLLQRPEFCFSVSKESRGRRILYQEEIKRKQVATQFSGSSDDFLKTCQIRMGIFLPKEEEQIERCYELIQRTNQLNISGYRYEQEEFRSLLSNKDVMSLGISCSDRYGDYGIVGYVSIHMQEGVSPLIHDFVLSCRVARKKVEHALFGWIRDYFSTRGHDRVRLRFIPTSRNNLIMQALLEVGFCKTVEIDNVIEMSLSCDCEIPGKEIIQVNDAGC